MGNKIWIAILVLVGLIFGMLVLSPNGDQVREEPEPVITSVNPPAPSEGAATVGAEDDGLADPSQSGLTSPSEISLTIQYLMAPQLDPLEQLSQMGIDTSYDNLVAVLLNENADADARSLAAGAIGLSGRPGAYDSLVAVYSSAGLDLKAAVIRALYPIDTPERVEFLKQVYMSESDPLLMHQAILGLTGSSSREAIETLVFAIQDPRQNRDMRVGALELINHRSGPEIDSAIESLLTDEDIELQARAAVALSRRGVGDYVPELVRSAVESDLPNNVWADTVNQLREVTGEDFGGGPINASFDLTQREALSQRIQEWFLSR